MDDAWEYHLKVVKNPDLGQLGDSLNRLGSQGWELVSTLSTVKTWVNMSGNDLVFVFKRRGTGHFTQRPEDTPGFIPS